ncbi:MAG: hypothetical protein PHS99_09405 [Candidatus Marinimicrobia bacterium]|nr:hypothetical protein [Candidatus Neomarinimicrobiota bacterium]
MKTISKNNSSASQHPLLDENKHKSLNLCALCRRQKKLSAPQRSLRETKKIPPRLCALRGRQIKSLRVSAPSAGGFTLIEIVAIVIITAILAVVVIPNIFSSYSSIRVSTAINQVADDIRSCREEAEATRDTCWILFDVSNNCYTLYRNYPLGTPLIHPLTGEMYRVQLGEGALSAIRLTSVSFSAPESNQLVFTPFGIPVGGGSITLNGSRIITIEPETGTLAIQ